MKPDSANTPAAVIDTNLALDLFVFGDAAARALRAALEQGRLRWLATAAMRAELARVLGYPQVAPRLQPPAPTADAVLAAFDRWAQLQPPALPAAVRCRDPQDQIFIDLAVAHRALLLSKDRQLLAAARQLAPLGVRVSRCWP
jgi:putative PIN family toxin of toxin-antitoxin system